jgi:ketosteroid isomerase-like protein
MVRIFLLISSAAAIVGLVGLAAAARETVEQLALQVRETETAFANTMAARDHVAFVSFVADEAVFFGSKSVLRGKAAVAEGWKPLFEAPDAPFSWAPDRVEVLDSGTLALSTGPIRDAEGKDAGTFMSVWRREAKGRWKIVFDKGCPPCGSQVKEADMQEIHKQLSVKCFNECWGLIEKTDRTAEDTENMLLLAAASLWHWKQRTDCQPSNLSVGYWQVSRVHALAGQHDMARLFGQKCLAVGQDSKLSPFYVGYAYEALARAEMLAGNAEAAKAHLAKARSALSAITDKEERDALEPDVLALEKMIAGK